MGCIPILHKYEDTVLNSVELICFILSSLIFKIVFLFSLIYVFDILKPAEKTKQLVASLQNPQMAW